MSRSSSSGGSKPGYTGHKIPNWSSTPQWGKGTPGLQNKRHKGRSHILDPRTRTAPPAGVSSKSRKAPSSVSPFSGGTL